MSAHATSAEDGDWWMPHAMLAAFAMLVGAILRMLFGWSAPLQAWVALAGAGMAVLAVHAAWRAARCARGRRWRHAGFAAVLAAALAIAAMALLGAGRAHRAAGVLLIDAPLESR